MWGCCYKTPLYWLFFIANYRYPCVYSYLVAFEYGRIRLWNLNWKLELIDSLMDLLGRVGWFGSSCAVENLISILFTKFWDDLKRCCFLGRVFGSTMSLRRLPFFLFSWTCALWKIWKVDNLIKRNMIPVHWICTCKSIGEVAEHLLLDHSVVRDLWPFAFSLFAVQEVMPLKGHWCVFLSSSFLMEMFVWMAL